MQMKTTWKAACAGLALSMCALGAPTELSASTEVSSSTTPKKTPYSSPGDVRDIAIASQNAFVAVAQKAIPAVVFIKVESQPAPFRGNDPFSMMHEDFFKRFFGQDFEFRQKGPAPQVARGTGFLVSSDGYILTNNHVIQDSKAIKVLLHSGEEYDGELVGADPSTDIAVVKIKTSNAPYLELANSDGLEVGQWAIACGNPYELRSTLTVGVISATGRNNLNISSVEDFIQTDAAINSGNSGGPLFNIEGQVIGINTAIVTRTGGSMGLGFAVPSNMAKHVMNQLVETGDVSRGYMGVDAQELNPELVEAFKLPKKSSGVIITEVAPDSPAEKAGLKAGDVIVKFNGKQITSIGSLRHQLALTKPGTVVDVQVMRDGKEVAPMKVTVADQREGLPTTPAALKKAGVDDIVEASMPGKGRHADENQRVVMIKSVRQGTRAAIEGLRANMVIVSANHVPVKSLSDLNKVVDDALKKGHSKLLLLVRQRGAAHYVTLSLK
jgi:serine protease Do